MLQRLSISNYALIDQLNISFSRDLTIMTGETGAGKSIILGALSLILGQRAEGKNFFHQDKKCVIEGVFDVQGYDLKKFFEAHDLDYDAETVLRREISPDGKTRAFINDTPVNLAILKRLTEQLVDIHSQHAILAINTEDFQLLVLDTLAAQADVLKNYQQHFKEHKQLSRKLTERINSFERAKAEQDYLQFQFNELEKASMEATEQEKLEQELKMLEHAEEIKRSLLAATYGLSESEQAAIQQIKEANTLLQGIEKFSPNFSNLAERLRSVLIEVKDIHAELEQMGQDIVIDEDRAVIISERLDTIYSLQKKHRVNSIAELLEIQNQLSNQLSQLISGEEEIEELRKQEAQLKEDLLKLAGILSENRKKHIPALEQEVQASLAEIGMPNAQLRVNQESNFERLDETGADTVEFLFSANKGQIPQVMNKVASGGELSRLMLSIKSLIAKQTALPTIIFDEIDTGISGEVALKVGTKMQQLAQHMQVITITHLPQIASKNGTHFKVLKDESGHHTRTSILQLSAEERVQEIAKMLSGENPGEFAIEHAKELLAN
ncbi:MAG: repair protein RecN [Bacteroidota bacterium]|jgi:DNA repair protein RecN (Recombination protein N)